jgi:hypothetical protein
LTRFVDRGALVAGWIGAGMAVVIVIGLELVIPIQPLVLVAALPAGAAVGAYANVRSGRRRPRMRALGNSLWAGATTGVTLAALYLAVRLLFIYLDTGTLPDNTRLDCERGPDCGYARFLAAGHGDELAALGVTDAAAFEALMLTELAGFGVLLFAVTVGGAAVAGGMQALSAGGPQRHEVVTA